MAFRYAGGPKRETTAKPASAFTAGDLLCLTSASSLSAMPGKLDLDIAGVAIADSTQSLDNQVPYVLALPGTLFWADIYAGSSHTEGGEYSIDMPASKVTTSATSVRFVVAPRGSIPTVIESGISRVLGYFLTSGSESEYV